MPLPININDLLAGVSVESERLEFKAGWNPEDIIHTLCAFANDFHNIGGGYILIGVNQASGQAVLPPQGIAAAELDKLQGKVLELGHKLRPYYYPVMEPTIVDESSILVLWALGGQNRPYKAPFSLAKDNRRYCCYIRKGSSTVIASPEEERELYELSANIPFDDRMNHRANISDLDKSLIQRHLTDVKSDLAEFTDESDLVEICKRMRILDGPPEQLRPRNVGLMLFTPAPGDYFPQTQIDIVLLPDGPGGNVIGERTFTGPVSDQVRDALSYLRTNIIQEITFKRDNRAEADRFFNYPYNALEEALVNAVYHRSYQEREPIEVRVLPDQITITSYPGPDGSISIEDLEAGDFIARRYRNRRVGEFLKELRLTEGRGTGVPKIIRAMAKNGSPPPKFKTDDGRSYFTAIIPVHPQSVLLTGTVTGTVGTVAGTVGTVRKVEESTQQAIKDLNEKDKGLLIFCLEPRRRKEMQDFLELRSKPSFIKSRLNPLLEASLLERTEPHSPSSPTQKYQTTLLGKAYIETDVKR